MYNMLKMKKMNGLKIFALVLLSLSKFETMFGMEENEKEDNINDEYVNKNYYLIDHLGNKITLDNDEDIKFKIYLDEEIEKMIFDRNKDILKISEEKNNKILVNILNHENEKKEEETYLTPIIYMNGGVFVAQEKKDDDNLALVGFILDEEDRKKYEEKTIRCNLVKKIGEDSINDDYILVDAENKKIEKINGKNILFKLLTRKKYLDLEKKLKNPNNYLKNDEEKYILDKFQNPLFFEEGDDNLILYVNRLEDNLYLAGLDLKILENTINEDNSIKVRMAKKEEIPMVEEEGEKAKKEEIPMVKKEEDEEDDSSKCCCGIC